MNNSDQGEFAAYGFGILDPGLGTVGNRSDGFGLEWDGLRCVCRLINYIVNPKRVLGRFFGM